MRKSIWIQTGLAVVVVSVLLAGARAFYVHNRWASSGPGLVARHPMPRLFAQSAVSPYATGLDAQAARAEQLMQGWWKLHGDKPRDRQFAAWLKTALPAPPKPLARRGEAVALGPVVRQPPSSGTQAAQWLTTYGARPVWQYYAQQDGAHLPTREQHVRKHELNAVLVMSKRVGGALVTRWQQSGPAVLDPALRPKSARKNAPPPGAVCPCTYPGLPQVSAVAAQTFLARLYPAHAAEYRRVADQLAYAQLYSGTRLPSDLRAGALLGDMIGDYFLVSRHYMPVGHRA